MDITQFWASLLAGMRVVNVHTRPVDYTICAGVEHSVANATVEIVKIRLAITGPILDNEKVKIRLG